MPGIGAGRAMSNQRLLAVDDNKPFLEIVRKIAVELDYDVELASDGVAFKKIYETFQPHTVLVDLIMPDIDGMELIQWLAQLKTPPRVIVVTGYSPKYANLAKMLGEGKGLSDVIALTKPIKATDLRDALMDETEDMLEEAE